MVIYAIVFLWALIQANVTLTGYEIFVLVEYIICGTIINTGIYTILIA